MARSQSRRSTSAASTSSRPRTLTRRSAGRQGSPDASTRRSRFVPFTTKPRPMPPGRKPRLDCMSDVAGPSNLEPAEVDRIFREASGRAVATLIRVFGEIDIAEDAVQEAFAVALRKWPGDRLPPNPGGWITTTARNRAIDRLRREARGRELLDEVAVLSPGNDDPGAPEKEGPVQDDRLRLIFTCCHPALSTEAQVALTLRLLGGLSTKEVARSFLVAEPTM